jgi:hypothetical protein
VRACVDDAVVDMIAGQTRVVGVVVKPELQDASAREVEYVAKAITSDVMIRYGDGKEVTCKSTPDAR